MHAHSGSESQQALYAAKAGAWMKLGEVRNGNLDPIKTTAMKTTGATFSATVTVGGGKNTFPPADTYYVEAVGTVPGGKSRKIGILASVSQSRWNHAAFGNRQVEMKKGSYTDAFNSDGLAFDHSKASIATNNPKDGIKIEDYQSVVIGWSGSVDVSGKRKKKKEKDGDPKLVAEANIVGPPGSSEKVVVTGDSKADRSYNQFITGAQSANSDPVVMPAVPAEVAPPLDLTSITGASLDTTISPLPSITTSTTSSIPPGAYHTLDVAPGGKAVLDVSTEKPGSEVSYVFHGMHLENATLEIAQPPSPAAPVTVKVYIDTGDGKDKTAGVTMTGSSLVNPSQKPINLQLLLAGTGKAVLEGHDELKDGLGLPTAYYVAYGPEATIEVTRGQIFGSVVADRVILDGDEDLLAKDKAPAVIHFDTALLEDTSNPPVLSIMSVRQY
jgi:hypothetical protein